MIREFRNSASEYNMKYVIHYTYTKVIIDIYVLFSMILSTSFLSLLTSET